MLERRTLLTAACGAWVGAERLLRAAPFKISVDETRVIAEAGSHYAGWPTMLRRRNGELLLVYSGGRVAHVCPYGRVELMRSKDDGAHWTQPEVLLDTPIDDRDAGICETASGALLVTTFTSLAYEQRLAANPAWVQAAQARTTPEQRRALLGNWMLRSADGGMTWSAPYRVPVNSPHGPVALKDGRLIYPGKALWADERVGVAESKDDGVTWSWLAEIPARETDKAASDYHELHGVEASDGRILLQIRNHSKVNERETLQCVSRDGGKNWSKPEAIGVWGLPSHLLRLRDGRLLMTYGYRRQPHGNLARVSEDHGATWSAPLTISADGVGGDLGYPSTVELGDGSLLTAWYERMADQSNAVLRQARWRLK